MGNGSSRARADIDEENGRAVEEVGFGVELSERRRGRGRDIGTIEEEEEEEEGEEETGGGAGAAGARGEEVSVEEEYGVSASEERNVGEAVIERGDSTAMIAADIGNCRVCLDTITRKDVRVNNNDALIASALGCKCKNSYVHLNKECGVAYMKSLRNRECAMCEVCNSAMVDFAQNIKPIMNASASIHDTEGLIQTLTRRRQGVGDMCEFFCFLVPCLPCLAIASSGCFQTSFTFLMRLRAYLFLGFVIGLILFFLSDVYLNSSRQRYARDTRWEPERDQQQAEENKYGHRGTNPRNRSLFAATEEYELASTGTDLFNFWYLRR